MYFARIITAAISCAALFQGAAAASIEPRAEHSTAKPVNVDHKVVKEMGQAAGLVQQSYCNDQKYDVGLKVGDAELLWKHGHGDWFQHVLIWKSDSLGIAVAYEGTNVSSIVSIANDALANHVFPDIRYKDCLPKDVRLMMGFQDAYTGVVDSAFEATKHYMDKYNETRVTIIGHSLGAAMGLLSAVDFNCRLDKGIHRALLFGLPRVGNVAFANYVDHKIGDKLSWVVNGKDWVPHMAPRFLGYQHPSNQIWINPANSTHWKKYPGQENVHGANSVIPEFGSFDDHQGIYFHTQIGASLGECPAKVKNY